jgi:two-component system sensor histidine kinase/response regulator
MPRLARLLPRTLVNRLFALYGASLLVLLVGGLALFLSHQFRNQVENTQQASVMLVEVVAQAVQDSVVIGDYDTVRKTLDKAVQESVFASATFIERNGARITALSRTPPVGTPPPWVERRVEARLYDVNRTVTVGGRDYGVLRLRFDARAVAADLWDLSVLAVGLGLASMVVGLLLMRILVGQWLGGLGRLQDFRRALDAGSPPKPAGVDLDAPVEIRQVVELFNRTADLMREREAGRLALDNQKFALDQHAIVSITDPEGRITYANDRFCEISGWPREMLLGENHRLIRSDEHDDAFFADLWQTIVAGRVWRGEIRNRGRSGHTYWVSSTIVPLLDTQGRPEQYIAIRTDITDRKRAEASLRAAKEEAERGEQAKGEFVANMSHEIRTPLNAVLGMLTLLRNTPLSQRQLDYANKAENSARSLLALLNDILDFSKAEAGMMRLDPRPFRVDRLLRDLAVILSASVGDKAIEVLFDVDPTLPVSLIGDDMRLQQVLINLGGNALKFTDQGEVRLSVRVIERGPGDALLEFSVADTGIGIAPEHRDRIFSGFSQAETSTTRRFGGTGLGLAISQRLLSLMDSRIELDSKAGQGSTFRFRIRLPIAETPPPESRATTDPALTDLRVLVVDDNASAREVLGTMVRRLGWRAELATSGPEAIAMARRAADAGEAFDAIFVDWQMPGMDGWETSQRLRRAAGTRDPSLVMMVTAHGRELLASRDPAQQALLGGFLVKPVTASMLFDAIASARGRMRQAGATPVRPRQRRLAGMRILLVEDNPNNQQVAQELLALEGALVEVAANGELGVAAVQRADPPFDAVLMDLQMPVMDGFAASADIRNRLGLGTLPIIAMTANAMDADRDACLAAGMNDHVGKPFDLGSLVATLLRHAGGAVREAPGPLLAASVDLPEGLPEQAARHGIDLRAALQRVEGETEVFLRLLRSFDTELADLADRFDALITGAELEEAGRLMHTIKGLAGMLGAARLHSLAAALEATLRHERRAPGVALHGSLRATLDDTRAGLMLIDAALSDRIERTPPQPLPKASGDRARVRLALAALAPLLERADMGAVDGFESLRHDLGSHFDPETLKPLDDAMMMLDFDRARQRIDELLRSL